VEESPQVLNKTKEQNKLPKTKSRTKSKKQGAKSTARDTELSPSSMMSVETPARCTRSSRKSKIDTSKKSKTMIDSDDNSEKENVSSNDADDVFN